MGKKGGLSTSANLTTQNKHSASLGSKRPKPKPAGASFGSKIVRERVLKDTRKVLLQAFVR